MGHLYTPNTERGIYVTEDMGATWKQTLYVNDQTGAIDIVSMDNGNQLLYAAMWERDRKAWNFKEGGLGSGVYESEDGGQTWNRVTNSENGFPNGENCGRIGLSGYFGPKGQKLYAIVDNQNLRPTEEEETPSTGLERIDFKDMGKEALLALDTAKLEDFLRNNGFPEKHTAESIFDQVSADKISPKTIYEYLTDANAELFDTPVVGAEVYVYDRVEGRWTKTHEDYLDDVVYSYGYYFGLIRVHPSDPNNLYIAGVPLLRSDDGGATWKSIQEDNQHADHHSLWLDPKDKDHFINGNDGGINITWDGGETYSLCNTPAVGQFYTVAVDTNEPYYRVYGGLQDNGVWVGPSTYEAGTGWHQGGQYPYKFLMGGDGMQVAVDTRTNETVYTGYQFGHYYRIDRQEGNRLYFHPKHELGERPLRWNWQTPIHLSTHNQDVVYMASNRFHRSLNKAEDWETLSDDLTKGGKKGNVPFGTCTTIDESPLQFGKLYVGTDDGELWRSDDGGNTWTSIKKGLPQDLWVTRVEASNHHKERVYVTLNGYRNDHFNAYLFVSEDGGASWRKLGSNLPMEPLNVVLEDPKEERILYVGSDQGMYISIDRGAQFDLISDDFPNVAVHDLVYQPQAKDVVIGTHGRSIYRIAVEGLQRSIDLEEPAFFEVESFSYDEDWGSNWSKWFDPWEPETEVSFFAPRDTQEKSATLKIIGMETVLFEKEMEISPGLNTFVIEPIMAPSKMDEANELLDEDVLTAFTRGDNEKVYLIPGEYTLELMGASTTLTVE